MADQTLDSRRLAREQEQVSTHYNAQLAELIGVGMAAILPLIQIQGAMLRNYADALDSMARTLADRTRNLSA